MQDARQDFSPLIQASTLQQVVGDPGWMIFDVRHQLSDPQSGWQDYQRSHIPGAIFLHQDTDLASPPTGHNGRHPLPDAGALAARLRGAGLEPDTRVVVYDAGNSAFAARAWWIFRWLGHRRVAVLDGGWQAWQEAGGSFESDGHALAAGPGSGAEQGSGHRPGSVPSSAFSSASADAAATAKAAASPVRPGFAMATMDAERILRRSSPSSMVLLDARDPRRYRGESEPLDPVAGHIPGALNRPLSANLDDAHRFRPPQVLREEFTALLGTTPPDQVVHYCGSGITACHNLFAMELAGLPGSALYPGSWSEWCSDPGRPVATG